MSAAPAPTPAPTPAELAQRLGIVRKNYAENFRRASAGDAQARAQLSSLRREEGELTRELAIAQDLDAERARLEALGTDRAERARRRDDLKAVEGLVGQRTAHLARLETLIREAGSAWREYVAADAELKEAFARACPDAQLRHEFAECGVSIAGLEGELLIALARMFGPALRRVGFASMNDNGQSLAHQLDYHNESVVRLVARARAVLADPDPLPPAA